MKIDIQDVKYWMDAIRNSEDRDRTLESFWGGQLQSKVWLISVLEKRSVIQNPEVVIHGGWNGVLATMLFNSKIGCRHITSVDIDPSCKELAYAMNKEYEMKGMFDSVTCDMVDYEYVKVPDIVINTSCEHVTQEQYEKWLDNVPSNARIVLQSNNYFELDEHINCSNSLEDFKIKSKLKNIEYAGELELPKYTRFMVVGKNNGSV